MEKLHIWYRTIHTDRDWANILIITDIEENLGLVFVPEPFDSAQDDIGNVCMANSPEVRDDYKDIFTSSDLLDYIHAVLHSTNYRDKHKERMEIDFSKVPCVKDVQDFWTLVDLGGRLQRLPQSKTHPLIQLIDTIKIV